MKYLTFLLLALIFVSCNQSKDKKSDSASNPENEKPVNIILLIGDGMGLSQVSSTFYYSSNSNFSRFSNIGLINTSSLSHRITDSGAGGTAFAIGEKTYNGAIGVGMDSLPRTNISEWLSKYEYSVGLVATCQITHATPAAFYAHVKGRKQMDDIAYQLIKSDVDFFAAGGTDYFLRRADGINYFDSLIASGFMMDTLSLEKQFAADKKYGFLMAPNAMPKMTEGRGDFLPNATLKALEYLSLNKNGFFLMVEGSQIDWAGHDNDSSYMIAEMLDFNKTVGIALDFAQKDGNTLVIVLADHETGGFALSANSANKMEGDYNRISPSFATSGHSASLIPVFAFGPGSELFKGIYQNNEIFHKMKMTSKRN